METKNHLDPWAISKHLEKILALLLHIRAGVFGPFPFPSIFEEMEAQLSLAICEPAGFDSQTG